MSVAGTTAIAQTDTQPPVLVDFSLSPTSVNTYEGDAIVSVTMRITDDLSGVMRVILDFETPDGSQIPPCTSLTLVSGDEFDGIYTCELLIAQWSLEGFWAVKSLLLKDNVRNQIIATSETLAAMGFPSGVDVGFVDGFPRTEIINPFAGKRVAGNSITVRARLVQGSPTNVSPALGIRFDYRALPFGDFMPIPARDSNHPNPDTTFPYFIHWDVSLVPDGDYELRAVAHDLDGNPDPSPEVVTITIVNDGAADIVENVNAEGLQQSQTNLDSSVENTLASGDRTAVSTATDVTIPVGALTLPTDTAVLLYVEPSGEVSRLEQLEQNTGSFVDVSLASGQATFEGGLTGGLNIQYSDSDQDGVVDGTSIREEDLELRYYDAASGSYVKGPSWIVLTEHNMVHTDTPFLGRFALVGPLLPRIQFQTDQISLWWDAVSDALSYSVYRGTVAALADSDDDGLPDSGYGDCVNHLDTDTTDTVFMDSDVPSTPGEAFFYLVGFVSTEGARGLGNTSAGLRRQAAAPCP